jgi:F0F1-type ATP synthase assembly protein I
MIVKIAAAIKSSLVAIQRLCFSHLAFDAQVSNLSGIALSFLYQTLFMHKNHLVQQDACGRVVIVIDRYECTKVPLAAFH